MNDQELAQKFGRREYTPVFDPSELGYHCPNGHTGNQITWSEFNEHIWCHACEKDYHYADECYLVRPLWMSQDQWEKFLESLPRRPEIRS